MYVTRIYSYVMVSLVCHPYVTRMYLYVIRMSLVCGFTMNPLYGSRKLKLGDLKNFAIFTEKQLS